MIKLKQSSQLYQVLSAVVLAFIVASFSSTTSTFLGIPYIQLFSFVGELFLNGLTLLVVPLVAASIIYGLSHMGEGASLRRLGGKAFCFYVLTTTLAILTGLVLVNLIEPTILPQLAHAHITATPVVPPETPLNLVQQVFMKVVPANIVGAAAQGNMLGIIFVSLLFGVALRQIPSSIGQVITDGVKGLFHIFMQMTKLWMKVMPIGVFGLIVNATTRQGMENLGSIISFFGLVVLGLVLFMAVIMPLLLKCFKISPIRHLKAMAPALFTAFSTSSSAATLPITMECVEKRAGVSPSICGFVVPLGTTVNMAGSALYECMAIFFIAQTLGMELTVVRQAVIVLLSLVTSMGIAGIPSGSLVSILVVLNALGLPAEGLALILPVDRILDMGRTTANVWSDSSCAVLVAKTEGENIHAG